MNDQQEARTNGMPQGDASDNAPRDAEIVYRDATTFSLTLKEVFSLFQEAGVQRSTRTLQRYCQNGYLLAKAYPSETGTVWYVDGLSVETKIAEILQIQNTLQVQHDTQRHTPSPVDVSHQYLPDEIKNDTNTPTNDIPRQENIGGVCRAKNKGTDPQPNNQRHSATSDDEKYVTVPVAVLDALVEQLTEKDKQIERRDTENIKLLEERADDRKLLGAAMNLIHGEDFVPVLNGPRKEEQTPLSAQEVKPMDSVEG